MNYRNNIFQRFTMWVVDCWRVVMDARFNPLKHIPDPSLQMYFTLVLFVMWSVYFGFVASYYMGWLGYSIVTSIIVHVAVILPVAFTNAIFLDAKTNNSTGGIDIDAGTGGINASSDGPMNYTSKTSSNILMQTSSSSQEFIIGLTGSTDSNLILKSEIIKKLESYTVESILKKL